MSDFGTSALFHLYAAFAFTFIISAHSLLVPRSNAARTNWIVRPKPILADDVVGGSLRAHFDIHEVFYS